MPTEAHAVSAIQVRARRVLRLAFGTALALWISQAGAWTLSFAAPVFTLTFLSLPLPRPSFRFFAVAVVVLTASVYGSFLLLPMLIHQPLAGLLLLALVLFHVFYFTARGGAAVIGTLLTIGITLTVAVGSVSVDVLVVVAGGLATAAAVGALVAWFSHLVLPDLGQPAPAPAVGRAVDLGEARRRSLASLAIVLPITVWFLLTSSSVANAAVMIKVAAMGHEAATVPAPRAARSLLLSTASGGLAAVAAWQLLSIWPSLTLYTLLIALAAIGFGVRIFEGRGLRPDAATWSYGLLTMIVILAPAVLDTQLGDDPGARFYDRLLMFAGASLYGCAAVWAVDRWRRRGQGPVARSRVVE